MLKYKIDVIEELKKIGISTYKIRKENLLGQAQLTAIKNNKPIHWTTLEKLCNMLHCQPSDILINIEDNTQTIKELTQEQATSNLENDKESEYIIKSYIAVMYARDNFIKFKNICDSEDMEIFYKWMKQEYNRTDWTPEDITIEIFHKFINWCEKTT